MPITSRHTRQHTQAVERSAITQTPTLRHPRATHRHTGTTNGKKAAGTHLEYVHWRTNGSQRPMKDQQHLLSVVLREFRKMSSLKQQLILDSGFFTKGNEWSCTQIQTKQLPGDASVTVAFANPISVAWQSSDLDKFVPKSAAILALASQTGGTVLSSSSSSTTGSSTTSTAPSLSSSGNSDLSTGAKAGIGVGVAIAGLAIVAGMLYWFFRRYQLTQKPSKTGSGALAEKRDIYGENIQSPMIEHPPTELDVDGNVYEAANTGVPVEAPTKSSPQELHGDMVPELSQDGGRRASTKAASGRW